MNDLLDQQLDKHDPRHKVLNYDGAGDYGRGGGYGGRYDGGYGGPPAAGGVLKTNADMIMPKPSLDPPIADQAPTGG